MNELASTIQTHNSHLNPAPQIIIITGFSGAGKSSVLRALEDVGFLCIDNLPLQLLPAFFNLVSRAEITQRVALGIDVRGCLNMEYLINELNKFDHASLLKIIFLTSSTPTLLKRFQETRRKHPLADNVNLSDAIEQERVLLQPLITIADLVLDTDQLTIHQLRSFVKNSFADPSAQTMTVNLVSFGFKYGIPQESNFMYDLRSLPNPFFISELRPLNGTHQEILTYLFNHQEVQNYWQKFLDFVMYSMQKAYEDGRFFLHIGVGCTGGRHRSVAFVHKLAQLNVPHIHFLTKHRDILRDLEDSNAGV